MNDLQISSNCHLCGRPVCVSLYLRVKPWTGRSKDIPRAEHRFFGYWPPESHLVEYLKVEAQKHSLQRWYEENCRGHMLDEIVEGIEQSVPPLPGVPVRIMWNPAPQVLAYMQAETLEQKRRLRMDIESTVRTINVYQRGEIRQAIVTLLNNTVGEQPMLSLPGAPVKSYQANTYTPSGDEAAAEIKRLREENERLLRELGARNGVKSY